MLLIGGVINRRKWNQEKRDDTLKKRLLRYAGSMEQDKVKIVFDKENTMVTQKDLREKELLLQVFQ